MNQRLFRYATVVNVLVQPGKLIELALPGGLHERHVWCFFQHDQFDVPGSTQGREAWIRFASAGALVAEFPAHVMPQDGVSVKMSNSYETNSRAHTAGSGTLWFNNNDGQGYYAVNPWRFVADCDGVTLECNIAGTVRILLAVLTLE